MPFQDSISYGEHGGFLVYCANPTFVSLYGYPGSGSAYGWSIEYPNSGKIMFYWVSSNSVGNNIQSSALTSGEWCHVIVTKDSTSANIYINNVFYKGHKKQRELISHTHWIITKHKNFLYSF